VAELEGAGLKGAGLPLIELPETAGTDPVELPLLGAVGVDRGADGDVTEPVETAERLPELKGIEGSGIDGSVEMMESGKEMDLRPGGPSVGTMVGKDSVAAKV